MTWTTILNFASGFILVETENRSFYAPTKWKKKIARKKHQTWVYKSSTTFRFFAFTSSKRENFRRDERAQKAPRESLFRRRSSSYLGQRPTAITGYLNIFQGCWNQCFQVWHCMSIAKSGKLRISQDFANSCRMPCFARLHVEEAIAEAEGVQTLQLCQTRQERKCIFATAAP